MRRALGGLVAVALAVGAVGCSTESEMETWRDASAGSGAAVAPEGASDEGASAEPVAQEPLLALTSSSIRGESCTVGPPRDLAWFDVQWEALADLDGFAFELVDPVGVRQVGEGIVVPPVNYGGRIDYSGATTWSGRADIGRSGEVSWVERDPVSSWVPVEGQTGLVVLHLRFDGTPASISGVRATWAAADGEQGETTVDLDERWTFAETEAGCA
ncbi:hypothetical protein GGQ22_03265 [Nocardioides sp. zg-579]|uniref:Lipoprotein n=1 Tax=Nocardioides marmotae TaxID=2663857 RepID=A0A6I3IUF3_9ACTN|nr:hypothetical protein [Nocardioides marmotae]MCR6030457.1 hypothetical protein [Gordonia jinghuaiqii]MTB94093.1 hypothetical protein [Nocardioides marmotae]QKE00394.1 hypothetical protein HPC71_04345 [Nocardioides marmotae]